MTHCQPPLQATVTAIDGQRAHITLNAASAACKRCTQRGGCQSLSVYQWFFADKPLTLANRGYHRGQHLSVAVSPAQLSQALRWLLGLPLAGFISGVLLSPAVGEISGFLLGVVLAAFAFIVAKQRVRKQLIGAIRNFSTDCKSTAPAP